MKFKKAGRSVARRPVIEMITRINTFKAPFYGGSANFYLAFQPALAGGRLAATVIGERQLASQPSNWSAGIGRLMK